MENHLRRPVWLELNAQGVNSTLLASVHTFRHCVESYHLAGEGVGVEDMEVDSKFIVLAIDTILKTFHSDIFLDVRYWFARWLISSSVATLPRCSHA